MGILIGRCGFRLPKRIERLGEIGIQHIRPNDKWIGYKRVSIALTHVLFYAKIMFYWRLLFSVIAKGLVKYG